MHIFILRVFLSCNAVASLDHISLQAGRVRPRGGGSRQFFCRGGVGCQAGGILPFLAPAVTVGETEGAMDSTSVFFWPLLLPITL